MLRHSIYVVSVGLNHAIVHAQDNLEFAEFLAHILDLEVGPERDPFIPVATSNRGTQDFAIVPAESIGMQHYAFLMSDEEFDAAFARIQRASIVHFPDPHLKQTGENNRHHDGPRLYFVDPAGPA
ncbi:hypothetical protein OK074_2693 [Actinobacteria bacterium OK074]|nr:hypothetical protein OK074_2693 [Actinobacteria bacterium OK074]